MLDVTRLQKAFLIHSIHLAESVLKRDAPVRSVEIEHPNCERSE